MICMKSALLSALLKAAPKFTGAAFYYRRNYYFYLVSTPFDRE